MTHTDDLQERVTELADRLALNTSDHERGGITTAEYLSAARETANDIIAAVHADIEARALSDEVIRALFTKDPVHPIQPTRGDIDETRRTVEILLRELGITESEEE